MMGLFDGTELERPVVCDVCGREIDRCSCPSAEPVCTPPADQTVHLSIEKRKKGKAVTVVRGLVDENDHLGDVLTVLKNSCGAGGTVKAGEIEIQGRQLDRVRTTLAGMGYSVKG